MSSADDIYGRLTAVECEQIAERFVGAMHAQARGAMSEKEALAALGDLWREALAWAGLTYRQVAATRPKERLGNDQRLRRYWEHHGQKKGVIELAELAGVSHETMRRRLGRMSAEDAVALGRGDGTPCSG